ncbi:peptide deformylase [Silanimonas sp.]|uniref:peptide deformylase n=1 Tax=Silanimonas sp. TaxID=1929290 RepID=UPI001BBC085E|nr:peptide deformylase [Silanimonas sp.]MBS3895994.1 peptide deformylase [Silanimonas sp.]MBS3924887.1 peptide deformylase [Xanthomonadaceae bacterium]
MALLPILRFPDPRLRTVAKPVEQVDDALRALIDDMFETMYAEPGIGLAATQVDRHLRLIVMDVSDDKSNKKVLINPELVASSGSQLCKEGCLSVPTVFVEVKRAETVTVRALDREGQPYEFTASGLEAVCVQHEIDHLDGRVFVDYMTPLKREMAMKKLAKLARAEQD